MAAEPGLTLTIYTAEPGSASAERMQLLASWAASEYGNAVQSASERTRTDGSTTAAPPSPLSDARNTT